MYNNLMNKILYTFATLVLIIGYPMVSSALTVFDVEKQLNIYKKNAPIVLGVSTTGDQLVDPKPLPPVPLPKSSTDDLTHIQLTPDQVKFLMQGLKYADPKGSSMIIKETIKPGQSDSGDKYSVKTLQLFLNATGCNLPTTGKYGAMTRKCVKEFQKNNNLKQDGIVGKDFRKLMSQRIDIVTASTKTQP